MHFLKRLFFFFALATFCFVGSAQDSTQSQYRIGARGGIGFLIAHNPTIQYFAKQHIGRFELSMENNTFGSKAWHQRYSFPRIGISAVYFNLNNKEFLGNAFSLSPHYNFCLLEKKHFQIRLKTAVGIGYVEKRFHAQENFKNAAIGSRFNLYFNISALTVIKLNRSFDLSAGFNFSHFSNTSFKTPNLGLNLPTADLGFSYAIGKEKKREFKGKSHSWSQYYWNVNVGLGISENYPPGGKKFLAKTLSIQREKEILKRRAYGLGLDIYYNPALVESLANDSIYIEKGFDNMQLGTSIYHSLYFGKFESFMSAGVYLKTNDKNIGYFYHIVGGRYSMSKKLKAFIALKTHFAKAEYLMWGVSINVNKKMSFR